MSYIDRQVWGTSSRRVDVDISSYDALLLRSFSDDRGTHVTSDLRVLGRLNGKKIVVVSVGTSYCDRKE